MYTALFVCINTHTLSLSFSITVILSICSKGFFLLKKTFSLFSSATTGSINYSDVFPLYFPKSFPHQSSSRGVYRRPFSSLLALLQICTSFKTFISSNHQCSASGLLQVLFPQNAFSFCTASSFSSCNLSASIPKADSPLRVLGGGVLRFKG